ncbi:hypothetical protein Leryth_024769 [Lithospermum erythrorhizon]|nr:hypothetical protein Leryth_024769 [Lithospermum erythrorhizon]
MGFTTFVGRLLFVSVFVISAYQEFNEFGVDGGPATKALGPKFHVFSKHVTTYSGFEVPKVEIKYLVIGALVMKGLGSLLFLLQQAVLAPILYDFYNYDVDKKEFAQLFVKFTQNLALIGALLFFIGMKNSMPRRLPKKKAPKPKTN